MIKEVVGVPPVGWEFLVYIVAVLIFLFVGGFVFKLLQLPFRFFRGRFF